MARWEPDAAGRLRSAAMQLFGERGFDETTVADIAQRAGVTERTYFRHFADKREVLFSGEEQLQAGFLGAIADAPDDASLLSVVAAALDAGGRTLEEARSRDDARARYAVIEVHPALQERECSKLARLAGAVADALTHRGVDALDARLAGDLLVSVFTTAFSQWIAPGQTRGLVDLQHEALLSLRALLET